MSLQNEKLLELLSIDCESKSPYIIVKLMAEDDSADIKWEIDLETAKQLKALIEPNKSYKYRLSFQSTPIPSRNINYSWITKTQGDKSDNSFFPCSNNYVSGLEAMKASADFKELTGLPSFKVLSPLKKKKQKAQGKNGPTNLKRTRLAVAILAAIAFILVYSGQSYHYEPAFAKKKTEGTTHHQILAGKTTGKESLKPKRVVKDLSKPVPIYQLSRLIDSNVPKGSVALTFDDGPSKHTEEIANILKDRHVGATFFFIGQNVKKYPDMVQYVHTNGFSIGNHSMTHPDLAKMSYEKQQQEISETNQLIEELTSEPVKLFRPPYEANNQSTVNIMEQDHLQMVLWDRDPRDWQTNDPQKILDYIKENDSSGTIILLHESQNVVDILPAIIDYLQSQHLQIVTLKGDRNVALN